MKYKIIVDDGDECLWVLNNQGSLIDIKDADEDSILTFNTWQGAARYAADHIDSIHNPGSPTYIYQLIISKV